MSRGKFWTQHELELVHKYYENTSLDKEEIISIISNRPWQSIISKALSLGLRRFQWKPDQNKYLIENYPNSNISIKEMEIILSKPSYCIHSKAHKLGLNRTEQYKVDSTYFNKMDTSDKWYIFGLLCADGHNDLKRGRISIALQEEDRNILDKISICFGYNSELLFQKGRLDRRTGNTAKNTYKFHFSNRALSDKLLEMGVDNQKTFSLKFNNNCPEEFLKDYFRGYFDGDGCIWIYPKTGEASLSIIGTEDICNNFMNLVCRFCKVRKQKIYKRGGAYVFQIGGNKQLRRIRDWIYSDANLYLMRKFNKFQQL